MEKADNTCTELKDWRFWTLDILQILENFMIWVTAYWFAGIDHCRQQTHLYIILVGPAKIYDSL
jgi:hypothetical protein